MMVENIINDKIQNKVPAVVGDNQINNIVQGAYVTKSNKFVTAKYKSNVAENKIMALAMTRLRVEHEHVVATIEAREAMAILGVKRGNLYRKLKDTSKRLVGHMFTIESTPGKFEVFPLLDKATYEKGLLTIKFSSGITPYIHNLKTSFTTYELAVLVKFEYNYSYRLYELLKKEIYRVDINETVVEKSYGLNELKCTIGLINMDERGVQDAVNRGKSWDEVYEIAKEKQYPTWDEFQRRVLKVAQKELEEKADIAFDYKTDSKGRGSKIQTITFLIRKNKPKTDIDTLQNEIIECNEKFDQIVLDHNLPEQLVYFIGHNGLSEQDLLRLYECSGHNYEKVTDAITLADRQAYIKNYMGWLISCNENDYKDPVNVLEGSHEKAEIVNELSDYMDTQKNNIAEKYWEKIIEKDDFVKFLKYMNMTRDSLEIIYEDPTERVDMYINWKKGMVI